MIQGCNKGKSPFLVLGSDLSLVGVFLGFVLFFLKAFFMGTIDQIWLKEVTIWYYLAMSLIIILVFTPLTISLLKNPGIPQIYLNRLLKELKTGKSTNEKDIENGMNQEEKKDSPLYCSEC